MPSQLVIAWTTASYLDVPGTLSPLQSVLLDVVYALDIMRSKVASLTVIPFPCFCPTQGVRPNARAQVGGLHGQLR